MSIFYKYWAVYGFITGLIILLMLFISSDELSSTEFLLRVQVSFLMFHQFEEYIFPGGFQKYFNENILSKSGKIKFRLNNEGIILINVVFGWTAYILAAVIGSNFLWFSTGIVLITFLNGILHSVVAVLKKNYNPGFATGLFLFLPFVVYFFYVIHGELNFDFVSKAIMTAFTGALFIPLTLFFTGKEK